MKKWTTNLKESKDELYGRTWKQEWEKKNDKIIISKIEEK